MVDRRNTPVEDFIRPQLQSKEEFIDQRSSHFKLYIAVDIKSLWKICAPSFYLPFSTVMTKLKLFHEVKKNVPCQANFRDKLPFVNSTKSLIFGLTEILLFKLLILIYCLIAKVIHHQILYTELKSSY